MGKSVARRPVVKGSASRPSVLDFRSDTVTQPTLAMRKAMADAAVGDDVYGEDETVNRLQEKAARLVGMDAALFVPTGTMGNQAALWVHSGRGGAAVCHETSHISLYEGGGASLLSGVTLRTVPSLEGTFGPADVERHLPPPGDAHFVPVKLIAIENTHNYAGGRTWSLVQTRAITDLAHDRDIALHLDGARIFNAAHARKTTPAKLCAGSDSVMFCLSKGLSAPLGLLLCGSSEFIAQAHTVRKTLGGGMRQAGHMAAAGLVALDTCVDRLADDHTNARALAKGLSQVPGLDVDIPSVETNMVMVGIERTGFSSANMLDQLKDVGVLATNRDAGPTVRLVTHRNVSATDCKEAVERIGALLG